MRGQRGSAEGYYLVTKPGHDGKFSKSVREREEDIQSLFPVIPMKNCDFFRSAPNVVLHSHRDDAVFHAPVLLITLR